MQKKVHKDEDGHYIVCDCSTRCNLEKLTNECPGCGAIYNSGGHLQRASKVVERQDYDGETSMRPCPICDVPISRWMEQNWDTIRSKLHPMAYLELCRFASGEGLPHPNEQVPMCEHCFIELSFGIASWNPEAYAANDVLTIRTKD